jgi:hypothetical protein
VPFLDCPEPAAVCTSAGAPARGAAHRLWHDVLAPDGAALAAAGRVRLDPEAAPGRVQSAGTVEDETLATQLRAALPAALGRALRSRMEWYACRGAFFHNDAHYGDVLFGAWCLAGPPRELVFPRIGLRVPARVGDMVVFDPFEPHAVLNPGATQFQHADYEATEPSLFLGFEIELRETARPLFAIGEPVAGCRTILSSRVAVHAETGELARPAA